MSKAAALEFVDRGVRVNTIVPGGMNTPITANVPPDVLKQQTSQIPMGKLGDPIDIANGALFLASDEAKYILAWIWRLPEAGPWVFELIDFICEKTAFESESARLRASRKGAELAGQGTWGSGRHKDGIQSLISISYVHLW